MSSSSFQFHSVGVVPRAASWVSVGGPENILEEMELSPAELEKLSQDELFEVYRRVGQEYQTVRHETSEAAGPRGEVLLRSAALIEREISRRENATAAEGGAPDRSDLPEVRHEAVSSAPGASTDLEIITARLQAAQESLERAEELSKSQKGRLRQEIAVLSEWQVDELWPEVLQTIFSYPEWVALDSSQFRGHVKGLDTLVKNLQRRIEVAAAAGRAEELEMLEGELNAAEQEHDVWRAASVRLDAYGYEEHRRVFESARGSSPEPLLVKAEEELFSQAMRAWGEPGTSVSFQRKWWSALSCLLAKHAGRMVETIEALIERERLKPNGEVRNLACQREQEAFRSFVWTMMTIARRAAGGPTPLFASSPLNFNDQPNVPTPLMTVAHKLLACDCHRASILQRLAGRATLLTLEAGEEELDRSPSVKQSRHAIAQTCRRLNSWFIQLTQKLHLELTAAKMKGSDQPSAVARLGGWKSLLTHAGVVSKQDKIARLAQPANRKIPLEIWSHCLTFHGPFTAVDDAQTKENQHAEDVLRVERFQDKNGRDMVRLMVMVSRHYAGNRIYIEGSKGDFHGIMGVFELCAATFHLVSARFGHARVGQVLHCSYEEVRDLKVPQHMAEFVREFSKLWKREEGASEAVEAGDSNRVIQQMVGSFTNLLYTALWFRIHDDGNLPETLFLQAVRDQAKRRNPTLNHRRLGKMLAKAKESVKSPKHVPVEPVQILECNLKEPRHQVALLESLGLDWPQFSVNASEGTGEDGGR